MESLEDFEDGLSGDCLTLKRRDGTYESVLWNDEDIGQFDRRQMFEAFCSLRKTLLEITTINEHAMARLVADTKSMMSREIEAAIKRWNSTCRVDYASDDPVATSNAITNRTPVVANPPANHTSEDSHVCNVALALIAIILFFTFLVLKIK
jgi:hypothetical protein